MAKLPPKRCTSPGCSNIVQPPDSRCPAHRSENQRHSNRTEYHRSNSYFYSSARWRKFRTWFLQRNPICVGYLSDCNQLATVVDHIKPIADGGDHLDPENCQPFCASCHSRKTQDDVRTRQGGAKTCSANRLLPTVQLKKNGRRFLGKGIRTTANSGESASELLKAARKRLQRHHGLLTSGVKGERESTKGIGTNG